MNTKMKTKTTIVVAAVLLAVAAPALTQASGSAPTDPAFQYTPGDFGVGRKHTANAWCNREIDKLLDETRRCFNAHPASECDALQKKNSKKVGGYIKSSHCAR